MYIIIGNFGNHSLAAMQTLLEQGQQALHFVYVETGWAADSWAERVAACSDYAEQRGVTVHHLMSQETFSDMVVSRRQFPSRKFQWCANFLKGLTILSYLDEFDPYCQAMIVSGKRQYDSRRYADMQEFEYEHELYQGRTVWHPLWRTEDSEFTDLISRAGFKPLSHPSLECSPCIHSSINHLATIDTTAIQRLDELEKKMQLSMFRQPIQKLCEGGKHVRAQDDDLSLQQFDLGCGAPWGCGE